MIVIPAMDIYNKKIARLSKGDFNSAVYYSLSPVEMALQVKNHGFQWLHLVDLEGAKSGEPAVLDILKEIKESTGLKVEFGGGIRNRQMARKISLAGADRLVIGSVSVTDRPEFEAIVAETGAEKIVAASDIRDGRIALKGWLETSDVTLEEYIEYCLSLGVKTFLCTDISRDGMLEGANRELYGLLLEKYPDIRLIASGGVKDKDDLIRLSELKLYGAVVGKALYENKTNLKELSEIGK